MEYTNFAHLNETYSGPDERRNSALLTFGGRAGYSDDESDEWDPSPDTMEDFIRTFTRDNSEGDDISSESSEDIKGGDESDDESSSESPLEIAKQDNMESDIVAENSSEDELNIEAAIEPDIAPVDEPEIKGSGEFDSINMLLERYAAKSKK